MDKYMWTITADGERIAYTTINVNKCSTTIKIILIFPYLMEVNS